jgi:hypothetical protein
MAPNSTRPEPNPEAEACETPEEEADRWAAWDRWERFVALNAPIPFNDQPAADAEGGDDA